MIFLKRWLKKRLINKLVSKKNKAGIRFILKLQNRLSSYVMEIIKEDERRKGGIHPKHWVTDFHNFFLDNIEENHSVLEVGCAYGHLSKSLSQKAKKVLGIDNRDDAISYAKENIKNDNLEFCCSDFFDFSNEKVFDVVVMSNVLEHIDDRVKFLKKASQLADVVLVRVPAFDRHWLIPYKKSLNVEWRLSLDHSIEHTEQDLRLEVEQANLIIDDLFCKWGNYCCVLVPETQS